MDIPFWLICSSVRHLDCFHLLRVILVCIFVHKFLYEFRFAVFLSVFLEEELLDNMVILNLTFCGPTRLFSIGLYHFAFLPALYKGSSFSPSSPTLVIIAILVGVEGLLVFPKVHKHRVLLQTWWGN